MIPIDAYEQASEDAERRYIVGSEGYLNTSWEPSEETKRSLACFSQIDSLDTRLRGNNGY